MKVQLKKWGLWLLRWLDKAWPFGKPALEYIETHLVDHCNLNCRGCSHFSPLAEPWFADLPSFQRDFERLSQLFRTIRIIRLMGGEPLLHPQMEGFLVCARKHFPKSRIQLVTNGLLVDDAAETFWKTCRDNRVTVSLTVYPPLKERAGAIAEMCRRRGVRIQQTTTDRFCLWMNEKGDSPREAMFKKCRSMLYCPVLRDGRIFTCATSAYVHLFNRAFRKDLPCDRGIDIRSANMTGRKILTWLNQSVELCRYCAMVKRTQPWASGRGDAKDWYS